MLVGLEEDNPCAGCHRLPADALLLYFLIFLGSIIWEPWMLVSREFLQ